MVLRGNSYDEVHWGSLSNIAFSGAFFIAVILEGGDAYAKLKLTPSLWLTEKLAR